MNFYKFDDAVDMVLSGRDDEEIRKMLSGDLFIDTYYKNDLLALRVERGLFEPMIPLFSNMTFFTGLYDEKMRGKTERVIKDMANYDIPAKNEQTYILVYHIIKNKCYDALKRYLDVFNILEIDDGYIKKLMGITVKLKDTTALRMFLERKFTFEKNDMKYLRELDEEYFDKTVKEEMKKHMSEEEIKAFIPG